MWNAIPNYAVMVEPHHDLFEQIYRKSGEHVKRSVSKIRIGEQRGASHDAAFSNLKSKLFSSTKLARRKPNHKICLLTDTSDTHWDAILTQTPGGQKRIPTTEQEHNRCVICRGLLELTHQTRACLRRRVSV